MRQTVQAAVAGLGLAILLLDGCHADPNVRKQKYLESGNRYSAQGSYREAAIEYRHALAGDPNFAEAHHELARAYLHLGQYSGAAAELARTVALQPGNHKARVELGNLLLAGGKLADAAAQAQAVLALRPDCADAHALLAALAGRAGNRAQALAEMQRAVQLSPLRAGLHEALAQLAMQSPGQAALAQAELHAAIQLDPTSARPRLLLAEFYADAGRWAQAEQVSWNAVAADPRSVAARRSLAQVLAREGKAGAAEQVLRQAAQELQADPQGVRLLADYFSASGQLPRASAEFAALCARHPEDTALRKGYTRALIAAGDYRGAQAVLKEVLDSNPGDSEGQALRGIVLLQNGAVADALQLLQNAALRWPRDAYWQYWLGMAALARGDDALAEQSFRRAAALDPAGLQAQQQLARLACRRGDMAMLAQVAAATVVAAPRLPDGYLWRARAEMQQPRRAEADLKAALAAAPQSAQASLQFGKLRFAQRRFAEGVALLQNALQRNPDSVEAMRMLIGYDLFRKRPNRARTRLAVQLLKRPHNSGLFVLLAQLEQADGQPERALVAVEHAIRLNSGDAEAVGLYTQLEVQRGQAGQAVAAWQQWLSTHPRDAGALAILGTLEEARGDAPRAEHCYREALRLDPRQPVAANNLAYRLLENGGDVDAALAYAQTAWQAMQNSPHIADTLAWAWYHKKLYGFARDLLEEAVKAEPNDVAIQYHLGMVYEKLRQKQDALMHLRKAIALAPNSAAGQDARAALEAIT